MYSIPKLLTTKKVFFWKISVKWVIFREFLAFATESVCASLDTVVVEEGIERLEMKLGVLQV